MDGCDMGKEWSLHGDQMGVVGLAGGALRTGRWSLQGDETFTRKNLHRLIQACQPIRERRHSVLGRQRKLDTICCVFVSG